MAAAPSSESDNCLKMNPVGPAKRYNSTRGQPLVNFSPSVKAWTGVPMVVSVRNRGPVASRMPTWPPHALPTQSTGSVRPRRSSACSAEVTTSSKVKSRGTDSLLPCDGPSMAYTVCLPANSSNSGPHDRESTKRLCHNTTGGPSPARRTCSRPRSVLTKSGLGVTIATLQFTSGTETSVTVVFSTIVTKSRQPASDRLGIRLTELAGRAQLSLAAASELVNDLAEMGFLTRRPDPSDGRAKLIDLTKRGRELMVDAGRRVEDIERRWSALAGEKNFDQMCRTMQRLLDELDPKEARS